MLGTMTLIVETVGIPGEPLAHNKAIEACVGIQLSHGFQVAESNTFAMSVPHEESRVLRILRITTIRFAIPPSR